MGAKCSALCSGSERMPTQFRDTVPNDIEDYHPDRVKQKLPKLSFQGNISEVKIINCPENSYFSIKIEIVDIIQIDLAKKKVQPITEIKRQSGQEIVFVQNELKWLCKQKLSFMMDEFELRTHFLNIFIYNDQNQTTSYIRVNLYSIVTGPYRYDFYIHLNNHPSRLLFEVYLSEKLQAKLQPLQVKIQLQKGYFAEEFNFSLKQLTHGQVVSTSKVSQSQKTLPETATEWSFDKQHKMDIPRSDSPMFKQMKGRHASIPGDPRKTLKWTLQTSNHQKQALKQISLNIQHHQKLEKKKLPHLKINILSNQIVKSTVHFNLWINKQKNLIDLPLKDIQKDTVIFGSFHINLKKIFDQESKVTDLQSLNTSLQINDKLPNYKLELRDFKAQENLVSRDGLVLGKCKTKFRMTNPRFFKQLSYCVKTQDGIINMTSAFKNYSGKSVYLRNPIIKDIINHSLKIHSLTKKLSIMESTIGNDRKEILKTQSQVYEQFQIINKELINSCSSSFILSSSNLQIELLETEDAFIKVLDQLYIFLTQKSWRFKEICWQIVLNIFQRGEFYLENLGFKGLENKSSSEDRNLIQKKMNVGLRFKCILYKFLLISFQESQKEKVLNKTAWKQLFKAFGCFRIPIYRDTLLKQVYKQEDQSKLQSLFPGFEEVYVPISSKFSSDYEKSANHLDWNKYFYQPLSQKQESIKLDHQLIKALQANRWLKVLKKKSNQFYVFIGYTSKIASEIAKNLKIMKWRYFPGYTKVVHTFLIEMKKQQLLSYSTTLIQASINLLFNSELINIMIALILQKTDVNNHDSLSKGLNIVWSYLSQVTQDGSKKLPEIFNYMYFYRIVKMVFECDNSFALGKVLIMIEYFFKSFNVEFKQNLAMFLMGKIFFKLFFHWSYAIRMVFHVIMVSKIHFNLIKRLDQSEINEGIKTKGAFLAHHQIQQRYSKIMHIVFNAEKLKKEEQNEQFYNHCFRQLHKKMQKKLIIKKSPPQAINYHRKQYISKVFDPKLRYSIQNLLKLKDDIQGLEKDSFYFLNKYYKKGGKKIFRTKSYDEQAKNQGNVVLYGQSFTLQDKGFEKSLKNFDTKFSKQQEEGRSSSEERNEKKDKFGYSSDKFKVNDNMKSEQQDFSSYKSMKFQVPEARSPRREAKYTYFGSQDNILSQMTEIQVRQILVSMNQFRKIKDKIQKFVIKNGRTPQFDFNVQLGRDQQFDEDLFKWKT